MTGELRMNSGFQVISLCFLKILFCFSGSRCCYGEVCCKSNRCPFVGNWLFFSDCYEKYFIFVFGVCSVVYFKIICLGVDSVLLDCFFNLGIQAFIILETFQPLFVQKCHLFLSLCSLLLDLLLDLLQAACLLISCFKNLYLFVFHLSNCFRLIFQFLVCPCLGPVCFLTYPISFTFQ